MMQATEAMERRTRPGSESQAESKGRNATLATRYGRIGISAVAAAVSQKGKAKPRPATHSGHALRYERE